MLSLLLTELFPDIFQHLSKAEIATCLQVNSSLRTLGTPVLWSTVTFGGRCWTSTDDSFLNERNHKNWKHVRHLNIGKATLENGVLEQLSTFLQASENISHLHFFGGPDTPYPVVKEPWNSIVGDGTLSLLYDAKIFSRIVHLSFERLLNIPLCSILAQCPLLRSLNLIRYGSVQETALDEGWPGVQLERLTFGPGLHEDGFMSSADLGVLLHLGRTESSLHSIHYFRIIPRITFPFDLWGFLNAEPSIFLSLRHLSLACQWTYVVHDVLAPNPKPLLPLSDIPSLQSLSMAVPLAWVFHKPRCKNLNFFFDWFSSHLPSQSNKLPPSLTDITIISEVWNLSTSQSKALTASPLPSNLTNIFVSSQLHFDFIVDTTSLREEKVANQEYLKCSQALKFWGQGLFRAEKMTLFQR
ncbi:hypothetical protein DL96DRAFT_1818121 [Flagelloscypha sp. PMI_526]|nr:hypothetical protein DL96DRAFT_1818121 [Flagelloscypha sp. PMI_526]